MRLSKQKPLNWFTELFTIGYLKTHTFSTIFIYAILIIAIIGFISVMKSFTPLALGVFVLKLIFALVIIYLIKLFFEKYRI
jgi:small-conductance mechanosensitive channel